MIEFSTISDLESRKKADLLVVPVWKIKDKPALAAKIGKLESMIQTPLETKDFEGREEELLYLYTEKQPEKRLLLLGLGEPEKVTVEKLRRAYGALAKSCQQKKISSLNLLIPHIDGLADESAIRGITEGLLLASYVFTKYKHEAAKEKVALLTHVNFIHANKASLEIVQKIAKICRGVYLARDLVNGNADEITPQYLSQLALKMAKQHPQHVKTTILGKKQIEKEGMGLLLAVNRGSSRDPALIVMKYKGDPRSKDHTVVIGKGITYDTGGLNLKPGPSMDTMKCDMAGGAVCFGLIEAAVATRLKVNFTVVIPSTENSIGSNSYKPGDIYTSYDGKTVEISDTDAEGRLVLADAVTYAVRHLHPTRLIDFATLTGGVGVALGWEAAGLMSTDDALADGLIRASSETFERLWRLPLYEEYLPSLKSDLADIKNSGGRMASPILGATFIKEFVGNKVPWAHCDIAYTAFLNDPKRYQPKYATGYGVRLMMEFFENLQN